MKRYSLASVLLGVSLISALTHQAHAGYPSVYEAFPSGEFDLGGKQVTFTPAKDGSEYEVHVEPLALLIDLEETWIIADGDMPVSLGTEFLYGGTEHLGLNVNQGGFLSFNDSSISDGLDCSNTSIYEEDDIIVAFCSRDVITLVRHAVLDDRFVVQWALPGGVCPSDFAPIQAPSSGSPAPPPNSNLTVSNLTVSQAELFFNDSSIRLSWAANSSCQSTVGLGIEGVNSQSVDFLAIASMQESKALNCSEFSVFGPHGAFPCDQQASIVLPQKLPPVILFSGVRDLFQQVVTIVNVAGQAINETGLTLDSPELSPPSPESYEAQIPESTGGSLLSGGRRKLHQDSSQGVSSLGGGLGSLQNLNQALQNQLQFYGPSLSDALKAAQNGSIPPPPQIFYIPAPLPSPSQIEVQTLPDSLAPGPEISHALSPESAIAGQEAPSSLPTLKYITGYRRRLLQKSPSAQAPSVDLPVFGSNSQPAPAPQTGFSDVVVSAVGIKETPKQQQTLKFIPAQGCSQTKVPGPCAGYSSRWFYDQSSGVCEGFVFGGCLGNLNNFASEQACERACIGGTNITKEPQSTGVSIPSNSEIVFLASALSTVSWVTLDATSDVLSQGASAALHFTYNSTLFSPGIYKQNVSITTNDPERPTTLLKPEMMLFCGRLAEFSGPLSTPNVTFRYLSGTQPSWARGADLDEELDYTYFEIYVIYDTPILSLPSDLISVEADDLGGVIIHVEDIDLEEGYGPMCSAFRIKGAAPLPENYVDSSEGTLLSVSVGDLKSVYGDFVPSITANKTLFNSLPQCTFYGQAMVFGGDFGLTVSSNEGRARATLVCTSPLENFCIDCIKPQYSNSSSVVPQVSFLGLVPGLDSQYDVEISWPKDKYFGELNFTVGCDASDDIGRPLAPVLPLRIAIVKTPQIPLPLGPSPAPSPGLGAPMGSRTLG